MTWYDVEVSLVLSVTFGSYLSKSFGTLITGCFISFRLPEPLMIIRIEMGSLAFVSVLSSWAEIVNLPTPPEKFAGRWGSGSTWISMLGATIFFLTSM